MSPARAERVGCWLHVQDGVHLLGLGAGLAGAGEHLQAGSVCPPGGEQAGRAERAARAKQAGPRGCDWILLGHAKPIDPAVIKVTPKPDSYSTLGGRSFSEKHPLLPVRQHSRELSPAGVLPARPSPLSGSVPKGNPALGLPGAQGSSTPSRSVPAGVPSTAQPCSDPEEPQPSGWGLCCPDPIAQDKPRLFSHQAPQTPPWDVGVLPHAASLVTAWALCGTGTVEPAAAP